MADFNSAIVFSRDSDSLLILFIDKNEGMEKNRIGISVSKKVGNSVIRHTLTRRIREIFRQTENKMKKNYDLIVSCKEKAKEVDFNTLKESFINLCRKQQIFEDSDK